MESIRTHYDTEDVLKDYTNDVDSSKLIQPKEIK